MDYSIEPPQPIGVAVVGAGYWGPNLVRNFRHHPAADLRWICDLSLPRASRVAGRDTHTRVTDSLDEIVNDDRVAVVAVATPPATHAMVVAACLDGGKHVLVEKPLASSVADGEKLVAMAAERRLVLMCDHTYCYTPAVRRIRDLIADGELGAIHYVDSVRINLGLIQPDIDVFWDLAIHDLAILDFILPADCVPVAVAAHGADPIGAGRACIGYLTLPLTGAAIAHTHVNWLSPTKIRRTIIGGSKRMVVWDDLQPANRLSIYDMGVTMLDVTHTAARQEQIAYRTGDMVAPALIEEEALQVAIGELFDAIQGGRPPLTDGRSGLRVLRILDAASRSLDAGGTTMALAPAI